MNTFWRNLAITVLVAAVAGAVGGWVGTEHAGSGFLSTQPLRQSVHDLVSGELTLTAEQKKNIEVIEDRYYQKRGLLRNQIAQANMELADALISDMAFGREAQNAVGHVQDGLAELQKATILYVLEIRDELTPDQQKTYDRRVREALVAPEP